jgi:hypothetical protein
MARESGDAEPLWTACRIKSQVRCRVARSRGLGIDLRTNAPTVSYTESEGTREKEDIAGSRQKWLRGGRADVQRRCGRARVSVPAKRGSCQDHRSLLMISPNNQFSNSGIRILMDSVVTLNLRDACSLIRWFSSTHNLITQLVTRSPVAFVSRGPQNELISLIYSQRAAVFKISASVNSSNKTGTRLLVKGDREGTIPEARKPNCDRIQLCIERICAHCTVGS